MAARAGALEVWAAVVAVRALLRASIAAGRALLRVAAHPRGVLAGLLTVPVVAVVTVALVGGAPRSTLPPGVEGSAGELVAATSSAGAALDAALSRLRERAAASARHRAGRAAPARAKAATRPSAAAADAPSTTVAAARVTAAAGPVAAPPARAASSPAATAARLVVWPHPGRMTGWFGEARSGHSHPGIDLDGDTGDAVIAAGGGTVVATGYLSEYDGYGAVVLINHGGFTTLSAHLSRIDVRPGQAVRAGQVVGAVGMTGNVTGSHLHFEVRVGGRPVDPVPYLPGR